MTPFDETGRVDEHSLRNLVNYVIDGGVDYLVALGTTSEAATMTADERALSCKLLPKRMPDVCRLFWESGEIIRTQVIHDLATLPYLRLGDAILSVTPYYNKPSQQGLYNHFKAIAEHTPLPVILYNVPGRTSVNMTAAITLKLARDFENIIAIKEASGNFEQATAIISGMPENFIFLSGDDGIALPLVSIGASGVISVIANVMPGEFSTMLHLALEGEYGEARQIHLQLGEMFKALFEEGNPAGIKAALHARGVIACQKLRSPLCEVSEALYQNQND